MEEAELQQRWRTGGRSYVVVRAIVDQTTQRAVLLLADSSCLLVLLAGRSSSGVVPITTVPAPCSDACFLRLQSASGFGRNKFGNSLLSPSPSKVAGFGEDHVESIAALRIGQQGETHVSWVQELREKKSSAGKLRAKGQGLGGTVRREFFVVTACPAKGGSCTDLRAWSCADPAKFTCADIELELGDKRVRSRDDRLHNSFPSSRARLDAPHGLGVKMAASINVLIVYSSSAGKLWVMVGKLSDHMGGSAQTVVDKSDVLGAEGSYEKKRLMLTKRAIVSCHGPVYSIHVSPLHLFLGENNGVRIWSLRSLIKPGSSGKSSTGQSKPARLHLTQAEQGSNKTLDCERSEGGDRCQHVTESSNASGRITHEKTCVGNGAHGLDENVDLRDNMGVSAMKGLPRKGLFSKLQVPGSGAHSRVNAFEFRSLSGLHEALKSDSSSENLSAEDDMTAGKWTMGNGGGGVIKNETRNGISRSYPSEHGGVSIKETKSYGPQGDNLIFSNTEALLPNECTGSYPLKTAPLRPRNGSSPVADSQLVISQVGVLPEKKVIQQSGASSGSRVQSKTNMNSSAGMWFVALNSEEAGVVTTQCTASHAHPRPSLQLQVVDMQGLSLKEYVVLDSNGELHLLTLHEVSEERKLESLGSRASPTLRHLQITMRVTSFAVLSLPPPFLEAHRDLVSPATMTAKRKLWISDGMYSVHIVILPEEKSKGSIYSSTAQAPLAVSQAVFMKDRVNGLAAGSPDTVVVLAKGKLFSYVIPGG